MLQAEEEERAVQGSEAADLIWRDDSRVFLIADPRTAAFANSVIEGVAEKLASAPGALHRMMSGAASAAEDLNVEPFQGLIEVIQNADDLGAREVRFALRELQENHQLLIVHNGRPVVCQQVLPMTLPYLTTKREDPNQKGRFGIGLKTLARISTRLSVHSEPYHFVAERLSIRRIEPEPLIERFYNPSTDTLIVLDLSPQFQKDALTRWFESWEEDGLLFLNSVCSFRWCDVAGETVAQKALTFMPWQKLDFSPVHETVATVRRRVVRGEATTWTVFSADMSVPSELQRAHKAKPALATISVAVSEQPVNAAIFVAFKTRVPSALTVSIDAQFDPSTAREELIDNAWNAWLIERCGDLITDVACGLLATDPCTAWRLIPLSEEHVGSSATRWPQTAFAHAFARVRAEIGANARIRIAGESVSLSETAYEDTTLSGLLDMSDIEWLATPRKAITTDLRDETGRWRSALSQIGVSHRVGTTELLAGFSKGGFREKTPTWWVSAADRLITNRPAKEIFGVPCWLTTDNLAVPCRKQGDTDRPLAFGASHSHFSMKWKLLDRLHEAYGDSNAGEHVRGWLAKNAAFSSAPDAETELAAFAELFNASPLSIVDGDLRELRDRFDKIPDPRAGELGRRVGAVIQLDGFSYKGGKKRSTKVSPTAAYLSRTLDGEHPYWPEAADTLPGIVWLSSNYDEKLKTSATRANRKRVDGTISRGPRKFLMLLGAECAPRLLESGRQYGGGSIRQKELRESQAELVERDYRSPDMERVLDALPRLSKKQRRLRSGALLKALSRHWDRLYASKVSVPALHQARVYEYSRGSVTAAWICRLRESAWVAVGKGDLVSPASAVIRTPQTEALYESGLFVCDVTESDVASGLASKLTLITDVRASDLVAHLERIRNGKEKVEHNHLFQIYRTLAKLCPKESIAQVGDLRGVDFRQRFSNGEGLISIRPWEWNRPEILFSGKDIFHQPELFVPAGPALSNLWRVLEVRPPSLTDCIRHWRKLATADYSAATEAVLIDIYRYIEPLLSQAERRQKDRLKVMPIVCFTQWIDTRPIYFVGDRELRAELAHVLKDVHFWTPPCDVSDLPRLTAALGLIHVKPNLTVVANRCRAVDSGDNLRPGFKRSVEHLSNELARNDAQTRERLSITWDELRDIPLLVYDEPFEVDVRETNLGTGAIRVRMKALLSRTPLELHVWSEALHQRDHCGRAIASLFPPEAQWRTENAWVASWIASKEANVEPMRFASDEEHAGALAELAERIASGNSGKVKVSGRSTANTNAGKPRVLKPFEGGAREATIYGGTPAKPDMSSASKPLANTPPPPSPPASNGMRPAPVAYTTTELEQRAWEELIHVLNTSHARELIDFRRRRGVGADGVIDWRTFVEIKATGRDPQSSIEMTNAEFERARAAGLDFILALVSGLEEGQRTEVRLILDPAHRATVRPIHGVRLIGLADAPAVVVRSDDSDNSEALGRSDANK